MTRTSWPADMFVGVEKPFNQIITEPYFFIAGIDQDSGRRLSVVWTPNHEDMLSADWVIFDGS